MKQKPRSLGPESTQELLELIRKGDDTAQERLIRRFLPVLTRWTHGRLPPSARGLAETDDLVQTVLIHALKRVNAFESRGGGSFVAYLRESMRNEIRGEIRKARRRPLVSPLPEDLPAGEHSPLEEAIGLETLERYERALAELSEEQREAIILRVEMSFSYEEIALTLGIPTANAARMRVARAALRLSDLMDSGQRARHAAVVQ